MGYFSPSFARVYKAGGSWLLHHSSSGALHHQRMDPISDEKSTLALSEDSDEEERKWLKPRAIPRTKNVCLYKIKKGSNKGNYCLKKSKSGDLCAKHQVKKISNVKKVKSIKRDKSRETRFRKLNKNLKYLLFKIADPKEPLVELYSNGKSFLVRLPRGLKPLPTVKNHFLEFSSSDGRASWKRVGGI